MKPTFAGLILLLVVSQAHAEYRTVLVQIDQDKDKNARVTIHSDEKKEQNSRVSVDEAAKVLRQMEGWGSAVGVYVASERGVRRDDRKKVLDAIHANLWLELEYYGREVPKVVGDYFLKPRGARRPGNDEPLNPLPGVEVDLVISVDKYNPARPSKGTVRCSVVNHSGAPVRVLVGYDGWTNRLTARGKGHPRDLQLFPMNPGKHQGPKPAQAAVKPGEARVVFELPLDEILFQGVNRSGATMPSGTGTMDLAG
ncbi:MAG: hypothetical protein L0Y71_14415 [Gemmataceae bacterium]|nr:hypothetical protein [Gemmataceae bacterium]